MCFLVSYLVVDAVEVGVETLVEPPAGVADLSTDVARVWCAEALLVVVPTERILHGSNKTGHMEAVPVLFIIYPAGKETKLHENMFSLPASYLLTPAAASSQILYIADCL